MVENLQFANIKEMPVTIIVGLILIGIILLILGSVLINANAGQNDHNKNFVNKLREKEKQLKDKEEKLREIEKQLRGG